MCVAAGREAETFTMNFETFPSVFLGHLWVELLCALQHLDLEGIVLPLYGAQSLHPSRAASAWVNECLSLTNRRGNMS